MADKLPNLSSTWSLCNIYCWKSDKGEQQPSEVNSLLLYIYFLEFISSRILKHETSAVKLNSGKEQWLICSTWMGARRERWLKKARWTTCHGVTLRPALDFFFFFLYKATEKTFLLFLSSILSKRKKSVKFSVFRNSPLKKVARMESDCWNLNCHHVDTILCFSEMTVETWKANKEKKEFTKSEIS